MTKKEFALSQIAPYYKNPETCGYEEENCVYKTEDGRMCVFGKNLLKYHPRFEENNAATLLAEYGESILRPEARGILTKLEWDRLQRLHDAIAAKKDLTGYIIDLGLFTFEELENYN